MTKSRKKTSKTNVPTLPRNANPTRGLQQDFKESLDATCECDGDCIDLYKNQDGSAAVASVSVIEDGCLTGENYLTPVKTVFKEGNVRVTGASHDFLNRTEVSFMTSAEFRFYPDAVAFPDNPCRKNPRKEGEVLSVIVVAVCRCAGKLTTIMNEGRLRPPTDLTLEAIKSSSSDSDGLTSTADHLHRIVATKYTSSSGRGHRVQKQVEDKKKSSRAATSQLREVNSERAQALTGKREEKQKKSSNAHEVLSHEDPLLDSAPPRGQAAGGKKKQTRDQGEFSQAANARVLPGSAEKDSSKGKKPQNSTQPPRKERRPTVDELTKKREEVKKKRKKNVDGATGREAVSEEVDGVVDELTKKKEEDKKKRKKNVDGATGREAVSEEDDGAHNLESPMAPRSLLPSAVRGSSPVQAEKHQVSGVDLRQNLPGSPSSENDRSRDGSSGFNPEADENVLDAIGDEWEDEEEQMSDDKGEMDQEDVVVPEIEEGPAAHFGLSVLDGIVGSSSIVVDYPRLKSDLSRLERVVLPEEKHAANLNAIIDHIQAAVRENSAVLLSKHVGKLQEEVQALSSGLLRKFEEVVATNKTLLYVSAALRHTVHLQRKMARNTAVMSVGAALLDVASLPQLPPDEQSLLEERAFLYHLMDKFAPECATGIGKSAQEVQLELTKHLASASRATLPLSPETENLLEYAKNDHGDGKKLEAKKRGGDGCVPFETKDHEIRPNAPLLYYAGHGYWISESFYTACYALYRQAWTKKNRDGGAKEQAKQLASKFMKHCMKSTVAQWNFWKAGLNPWAAKMLHVLEGLFEVYGDHMNAQLKSKGRIPVADNNRQRFLDDVVAVINKKCGDLRSKALYGNNGTPPKAKYAYGFRNKFDFVIPLDKTALQEDPFMKAYTVLDDLSAAHHEAGDKTKSQGKQGRTSQKAGNKTGGKRQQEQEKTREEDHSVSDEDMNVVVEEIRRTSSVVRRTSSVLVHRKSKAKPGEKPKAKQSITAASKFNTGLESFEQSVRIATERRKATLNSGPARASSGMPLALPAGSSASGLKRPSQNGPTSSTPAKVLRRSGNVQKPVEDEDDLGSSSSDEDRNISESELVNDDSSIFTEKFSSDEERHSDGDEDEEEATSAARRPRGYPKPFEDN